MQASRPTGEQWRCAHCGEPIGAYEPMVTVEGDRVRRTSRTVEQRTGGVAVERYHHACYVLAHGEPPHRAATHGAPKSAP
ncbi:MAG: hypothetical protein ACTHM1_09160 [Solirubrobacteraceae bacterium]